MPRKKIEVSENIRLEPPAIRPEDRDQQMIALAIDCAEAQLRNHTASPMVVCHYLKMASPQYKMEMDRGQKELELMDAKIEAYKNTQTSIELYEKAIAAINAYKGEDKPDER